MPCCPPPAQVFAQQLPKQHGIIIIIIFNFQILKIKNDLKIKVSLVSWGIVEYNLIERFNFFKTNRQATTSIWNF
jgi:hypothetical protein